MLYVFGWIEFTMKYCNQLSGTEGTGAAVQLQGHGFELEFRLMSEHSFACSLHVHVCFHWVFPLPPTVQTHASRQNGYADLTLGVNNSPAWHSVLPRSTITLTKIQQLLKINKWMNEIYRAARSLLLKGIKKKKNHIQMLWKETTSNAYPSGFSFVFHCTLEFKPTLLYWIFFLVM